MSTWIIGIDPGVTGAMAAMNHLGEVLRVIHTPVTPVVTSGKTRHKINIPLAVEFFREIDTLAKAQSARLVVYIEQVSSRPTDGGIQGFNFGRNFGQWEGVVVTLGFPLQFVTPQVWKRQMISKTVAMPKMKGKLSKKEQNRIKSRVTDTRKKLAIEMANSLFPAFANILSGHKADGPAEALLLAEWGRRKEHGLLGPNRKPEVVLIEMPERRAEEAQ